MHCIIFLLIWMIVLYTFKLENDYFLEMEDKILDTCKKNYTEEAAQEFSGTVYVPEDLEKILL